MFTGIILYCYQYNIVLLSKGKFKPIKEKRFIFAGTCTSAEKYLSLHKRKKRDKIVRSGLSNLHVINRLRSINK